MAIEGISNDQLRRRGVAAQTIKDALIPIVADAREKLLVQLSQASTQDELLVCKAEAKTILNLQRQIDGFIRQGQKED